MCIPLPPYSKTISKEYIVLCGELSLSLFRNVKTPLFFPKDINKFLWMVRIGGSTEKGKHIKEQDYYTSSGEFRVDKEGSPVLLNCLMYKMCYYRFGAVYTEQGIHVDNLLLVGLYWEIRPMFRFAKATIKASLRGSK